LLNDIRVFWVVLSLEDAGVVGMRLFLDVENIQCNGAALSVAGPLAPTLAEGTSFVGKSTGLTGSLGEEIIPLTVTGFLLSRTFQSEVCVNKVCGDSWLAGIAMNPDPSRIANRLTKIAKSFPGRCAEACGERPRVRLRAVVLPNTASKFAQG
jgi:hypothetical protein